MRRGVPRSIAKIVDMSHILPKKEWHVYSEKNKEKVRHDEEGVRIREERLQAKAEQSTRESRLNMLRMRAGLASTVTAAGNDHKGVERKHVDLFEKGRNTPDRLTFTQKELRDRRKREAPYTKHMTGEESIARYRGGGTEITDYQQERLRREDPMAGFIDRRKEQKVIDELNDEDAERKKQGKKYHSQFMSRESRGRIGRSKSPPSGRRDGE